MIEIEKIYLTIIFILSLTVIGFIFYFLFKRGKEGYISLKVSKEFEKELEKLMEEEMRKVILQINQSIQNLISKMLNFYKTEISAFSQKADEEFLNLIKTNKEIQESLLRETKIKIKNLEEEMKKEILRFSQTNSQILEQLSKSLVQESRRALESNLETMNQKILLTEKTIEDYKKERLEEIDKKIYQLIGQVAKKVIGKTIDLSTHEELVMEALEKVKKEKFF
jgi:F0F1-type ATP synthase membrane subunit b/b'